MQLSLVQITKLIASSTSTDCSSGIDVIFVLDSSSSVGSANFENMKDFVNNIVSNFEIGADKTRVGIIKFQRNASIILPLGSINNGTQLNDFIKNIPYFGRGTRTDLALNLVIPVFNTSRTSQGIPRVTIVCTDGRSSRPSLTFQAAQAVHDAGISVYSLGIGRNINESELNAIATSSNHVFYIDSFSASDFADIVLLLQTSACTSKFNNNEFYGICISYSSSNYIY